MFEILSHPYYFPYKATQPSWQVNPISNQFNSTEPQTTGSKMKIKLHEYNYMNSISLIKLGIITWPSYFRYIMTQQRNNSITCDDIITWIFHTGDSSYKNDDDCSSLKTSFCVQQCVCVCLRMWERVCYLIRSGVLFFAFFKFYMCMCVCTRDSQFAQFIYHGQIFCTLFLFMSLYCLCSIFSPCPRQISSKGDK